MELNKKSFALTAGILYGIGLFLTTFWVIILGRHEGLEIIKSIYPGYSVSILGAFIGLVYAFVDGIICGFIFAWLYNKLLPKSS